MMNKIGVTALALVMVLACSLAMVSEPADAVDRDVQMSLGTVSSQQGATVAVDLTIDKNIGFFGAQIEISYDSNLTLVGVEDAGIMKTVCGTSYTSPYSIYIQSDSLENTTATGTVVTLTFKVSSSAPDEMPVSFESVSMYNYDEDQISPALVDGKVVIGEISIPVTGVAVTPATVTLDVGDTATLTATIAPTNATNKKVTWSSSDTSVATVDNGTVKAVGYGTALIIVTTEDGEKKSSCGVTVEKPTTPVTGVKLSKNAMTISVGSTDSLTATVSPSDATDKSVKWSSSNNDVATVVDGAVTGVKEGTAVIIVTTTDGGHVATCTVTVEKAPDVPVPVTGISLDKGSVSLDAGKTATLTATVSPSNATNKGVVWTSSNTAVATVSNGVVTAVNAGTATITAMSMSDSSKTATCAVTVTSSAVSVTGVTLNKTALTLEEGKSATLTANVQPSDATNKAVTWTSGDTSVVTVSNGVVKAVQSGVATVTVTTADGGYSATCTVTVNEPSAGGDNTMLYLGIVIAIILVLLILVLFLRKSGKI